MPREDSRKYGNVKETVKKWRNLIIGDKSLCVEGKIDYFFMFDR